MRLTQVVAAHTLAAALDSPRSSTGGNPSARTLKVPECWRTPSATTMQFSAGHHLSSAPHPFRTHLVSTLHFSHTRPSAVRQFPHLRTDPEIWLNLTEHSL